MSSRDPTLQELLCMGRADFPFSIKLSDEDLGGEKASELAAALRRIRPGGHLFGFAANKCKIDAEGTAAIMNALSGCHPNKLEFNDNPIGVEGARSMAKVLPKFITLMHLKLSNTGIGAEGAQMLMKSLQSVNEACLMFLNLNDNNLGPQGIQAVVNGMKRFPYMKELRLGGNNMGFDGACRVGELLSCYGELNVLDLSGNRIDADGACAIAEGLRSCSELRVLLMKTNPMGPEGVCAVLDALKRDGEEHASIVTIAFSGVQIGREGARALIDTMPDWPRLYTVGLARTGIVAEDVLELCTALEGHPTLTQLVLALNGLDEATKTSVKQTFPKAAV